MISPSARGAGAGPAPRGPARTAGRVAGRRSPWAVARLWLARAGVWLLRPGLELMLERVRLWEHLVIGPRERVEVHPTATISNAILNSTSGNITIERNAFFGQHVLILAGTHDTSLRGRERFVALPGDGHDVRIEEGAWVASGAIIIGPCVVGRDAVVAAGSVVTSDVEPGTMVAGIPARFIRRV